MRINLRKDYRKILAIPENATNDAILNICAYALENSKDEEIIEAATVLINPQIRKKYDEAREKAFEEQKKAEEDRKNKEADAKKIAEEKENKAKRKAERELERDKRKIAQSTAKQKEKIIDIYTDDLNVDNSVKASKSIIKKHSVKYIAALIAVGVIFVGAWNKDIIKEKYNTIFDKDNEDINYDDALAITNLNEVETQEITQEETTNEDDYDLTITFTNALNEGQVQTRAIAINNYFRANNYHKISNDEIANQIKYLNGSYQVSNDSEAYDMQDSILKTFEEFASTIKQNENYISGVSENGIMVGLGLDAYLLDNSPNKNIVIQNAEVFQNLVTAETDQERVNAANEFITFEYNLMPSSLQNDNEEMISFESLDSNERFLTGIIIQLGNTSCPSIIGENGIVPYINNNNVEVSIDSNKVYNYFDPHNSQDGELDYEHAWVKASMDLVATAEEQKLTNSIN